MQVLELLNAAKERQGIATDKALAEQLGVTKQAVSNWRKGVSLPDTVTCGKLATLTGLPLAKVLGIVGEARAISREEKAVWKRLATAAALALCAIGVSMPLNSQASETSGMHLMFQRVRHAWIRFRVGTLFALPQAA